MMAKIIFDNTSRSKYRNKRVKYDGITFDSIRERDRYKELKLMQTAGEIEDLCVHVSFPISLGEPSIHICFYEADFAYKRRIAGQVSVRVIEDAKGKRTDVYKLKKRLMMAAYQIDIKEV